MEDYENSFGNTSVTYLIQEFDILFKIIDKASNYTSENDLYFVAEDFTGKHFRHLYESDKDYDTFIKRVREILFKFEKYKLIKKFSIRDIKHFSPDTEINIEVQKGKIDELAEIKYRLEMFLDAKKHKKYLEPYFQNTWWQDENTFCVKKIDGSISVLSFFLKKGKNDQRLFFKFLYKHLVDFGSKTISESEIKDSLGKMNPELKVESDRWFVNMRKNLNDKFKYTGLENYILIDYDR